MTESIMLKDLELGAGMPKTCVSMMGQDREALLKEAEAVKGSGAQIAEWRADYYRELSRPEKVKTTLLAIIDILGQIPLIFTIRTQGEGGAAQISPMNYVNINRIVSSLGCVSLIDVEFFRDEGLMRELIGEIHQMGGRVIVSHHDFHCTPPNEVLTEILEALDSSGGDVVKLACMPKILPDVWRLLEVTSRMTMDQITKPVVTMSMGELGKFSRFSGEFYGSAMTFGALESASAPGQPPIAELREMLEAFHEKAPRMS